MALLAERPLRTVPDVAGLGEALRDAWQAGTSADSASWSPRNPSSGQCAVTALAVQALLGGELLRAKVGSVSHYWNRLPGGEELDFTRDQFPSGTPIPRGEERSREYVLSFPETRWRYEQLRRELTSHFPLDAS